MHWYNADAFVDTTLALPGVAVEGVFSHLFGEHDGQSVALESPCDAIGTIPYEVPCMIADRVPRIYGSSV